MLWATGSERSRPSGTSAHTGGAHANLVEAFLRIFNQQQLL